MKIVYLSTFSFCILEVLYILVFLDSENEFENDFNINAKLLPKFLSVSKIPLELEIPIRGNSLIKWLKSSCLESIWYKSQTSNWELKPSERSEEAQSTRLQESAPAALTCAARGLGTTYPCKQRGTCGVARPSLGSLSDTEQGEDSTARGWGMMRWQSSSKNKLCTS